MIDLSLCFKVVRHPRQDSELRWSLFAPLKYEVAYRPGRNTGPMVKGSKLYAFETQRRAMKFAEEWRHLTTDFVEVWVSLAENVKRCEWVSYLPPQHHHHNQIDHFWSLAGNPSIGNYWVAEPPLGTIECEALMLVSALDRLKGTSERPGHFYEMSA